MRDHDDRVIRGNTSEARVAWGRKHSWALLLALGVLVLAFCAWALARDLPAAAAMNVGFGAAFVVLNRVMFTRRDRWVPFYGCMRFSRRCPAPTASPRPDLGVVSGFRGPTLFGRYGR